MRRPGDTAGGVLVLDAPTGSPALCSVPDARLGRALNIANVRGQSASVSDVGEERQAESERESRRGLTLGVAVAVGVGLGTAIFSVTGAVVWIAIGPALGVVIGAAIGYRDA